MYQKITIVGNLGKDPEMRFTPSGQAVTSFNLATNRSYTGSDGQRVKETVWFRVSVWGKQAENCNNYLRKGSKVLIEGRLIADPATGGPRTYNRQDGSTGASFEINASTVQFLDSRAESEQASTDEMGTLSDDEIPF